MRVPYTRLIMKRNLLCLFLCLTTLSLYAQPWMHKTTEGPIKLADVIKNYKEHPMQFAGDDEDRDKHEKGGKIKEGNNYHFDRWVWYWQQHLDENGYMVNPIKTWEEWEKYLASKPAKGSQSRTTSSVASNWVFQGPDTTAGGYSGIGRINTLALHPSNPRIIYAGSAGGGLWKTIDSARHWAPLYGNYPTLGVSEIVINPRNPSTVYVGTGDADGWSNFSMGVLKSYDAGATWHNTCLSWTPFTYNWIRSIIINPLDTNRLILASRNGIIITNNGFGTSYLATTGDFNQVLYHPTDTNIVYAARYALYPDSSSQILRSTDGGISWTQITHFTDAQRINLAICPASPNIVKAIVSNPKSGLEGIYGSTNSGLSYSALYTSDTSCTQNLLGWDMGLPSTSCGGQGWYDLCIAMDPGDANKVVIGGVNNYYSADGGYTWQIATTWYSAITGVDAVHADKHCLKYSPLNHNLYEGCDGGIYSTANPIAAPWVSISNGLGITQFYRAALANGVPWCIGGAQDNGTKMVNGSAYTDLTGGDGMQCRVDYDDPNNTWYTSSQNGWLNRTTDGGLTYSDITSSIPDTLNGIWITPFIIHPHMSTTLLVGIDILFSSPDQGGTWNAISPQFAPNNKISQIAMTPANDSFIYVEIEGSYYYYNKLYYTTNYGSTWDTITTYAFSNSISRLAVEPKNEKVLWVSFSGYGTDKVGSYNLTTGVWTMCNTGLPNVPVNCITIDSFSDTKYVGTDVGVYYMDTTMSAWALYSNNLPTVQVEDLNINYTTGEVWAATYGRGMWKSVKHEAPNSVSIVPYAADIITVAPNPNRGVFTIKTNHQQLKGQNVSIRMIATNGTTVWNEQATFDASGMLKVTTRGLTAGVYVCEVGNSQTVARSRVMVY